MRRPPEISRLRHGDGGGFFRRDLGHGLFGLADPGELTPANGPEGLSAGQGSEFRLTICEMILL